MRPRTRGPEGQLLSDNDAEGHVFGNWLAAHATQGDQVVLTRMHRVLSAVDLSGYDHTLYVSVFDGPAEDDALQP